MALFPRILTTPRGNAPMDDEQCSTIGLLELERLATLQSTALLDSPAEEAFDQFTRLASTILETPVALVSLVDQNRQFFKSSVGLSEPWNQARQTPLSHSFCKHVVQMSEPLSVADARIHPVLQKNLAVSELGVVAYLGIPLTTSQGHTLGSFCVIDSKPRQWSDRDASILQNLANLVIEKIELRIFAKQLHGDYLALRQLELYRDEMVEMLVHDLRNPMSSFLAGLELIQISGELPQLCQEYVDLAYEGGNELLGMINRILEISKAEAGHLKLDLKRLSPSEVIASACSQMAPLAEKSGITICQQMHTQLSCTADTKKLHRVLVNLISNAIQHTPRGGNITVSVQADEPADNPQRPDEETRDSHDAIALRFSVIDTGQGIPDQAFEKIFHKFSQVKNSQVAEASTGLGLPFSRMVVEAHGGRIWLESELGEGTRFHFTIPASQTNG